MALLLAAFERSKFRYIPECSVEMHKQQPYVGRDVVRGGDPGGTSPQTPQDPLGPFRADRYISNTTRKTTALTQMIVLQLPPYHVASYYPALCCGSKRGFFLSLCPTKQEHNTKQQKYRKTLRAFAFASIKAGYHISLVCVCILTLNFQIRELTSFTSKNFTLLRQSNNILILECPLRLKSAFLKEYYLEETAH